MSLRISKHYTIDANIYEVWKFISNLDMIARCIPDLEDIDIKDSTLKGKVRSRFSFIKGKIDIESSILDSKENEHLEVSIRGKTIGSSFIIIMDIDLSYNTSTTLNITMNIDTHGLLKHIPNSLIYKIVDDLGSDMLRCIKDSLECK